MPEIVNNFVPVSVVIPNYNSGGYLQNCVKSINAGVRPKQIIIVDDCSSDESPKIAAHLSREFENVEWMRGGRHNQGIVATRRRGVEATSNEWIAHIDADDTVEEGAIASAYDIAVKSGSDICVWQIWKTDGERLTPHVVLDPIDFPMSGREAARRTLGWWRMHSLGVLKKQLYIDAYLGFYEDCYNADELITRRVLFRARSVSLCDKKYLYLSNSSSISRSIHPRRLGIIDAQIWLIRFCIDNNYSITDKIRIVETSIGVTWWVYRNRNTFGTDKALEKINTSISVIQEVMRPMDWLRLNPKHIIAFSFLRTVVSKV